MTEDRFTKSKACRMAQILDVGLKVDINDHVCFAILRHFTWVLTMLKVRPRSYQRGQTLKTTFCIKVHVLNPFFCNTLKMLR